MTERRACHVLGQPRSTQRYSPIIRDDEEPLTAAIVRLAGQYGRYGYRRIAALRLNDRFLEELEKLSTFHAVRN